MYNTIPAYTISEFTNLDVGRLRAVNINGVTWFVAKDVCDALDIKNARDAISRIKTKHKLPGVGLTDASSNGVIQERKYTVIDETGLYDLILSARKSSAVIFKDWVTEDVLPSIRRDNIYAGINHIKNLKSKNEAIKLLTATAASTSQLVDEILSENDKLREDADFAKVVTTCDDSKPVEDVAKMLSDDGYNTGRNKLYKWLRDNKWIEKGSDIPYQTAINKGWMTYSVDRDMVKVKGKLVCMPRITSKGIKKIYKEFESDQKSKKDKYDSLGIVKKKGKQYYDKDGFLVLLPRK